MLHHLTTLSANKCPKKRKELLSAVADLFLHRAAGGLDVDSKQFHGVMSKLFYEVEVSGKVAYSEKMAPSQYTPPDIAERLARDDNISIAAPVLRNSPVLTDDILVDVARENSQEHMKAISTRATVSEAVTDVLVERGNQDVVRSIASNTGASFSGHGFAKLAKRSHSDEALAVSLFARTDIAKDTATRLIRDLPNDLRCKLDLLAEANASSASTLVQKAVQVATGQKNPGLDARRRACRELLAAVQSGKSSIDDVVTQITQTNRRRELAIVLARLADIPEHEVESALSKTDLTAIAIICKELQMARSSFESVAIMIGRELSLPESHISHFVNQYGRLAADVAARVSRFVSVRRKLAQSV